MSDKRSLQLDRRRIDLFETDAVGPGRISDDVLGPQDDRVGEVQRVGPLAAGEQRLPLGNQPANLGIPAEPGGFRELAVDLVDLRS